MVQLHTTLTHQQSNSTPLAVVENFAHLLSHAQELSQVGVGSRRGVSTVSTQFRTVHTARDHAAGGLGVG